MSSPTNKTIVGAKTTAHSPKTTMMKTAIQASKIASVRQPAAASMVADQSKPVNRNLYESVGNEPATPGVKGDSGLVNRNVYEDVKPDEDTGKPGAGTGYVLVGKAGVPSERVEPSAVMEEAPIASVVVSDRSGRRDRRRRRKHSGEAFLTGQTRTVVIVCSAIIGVILVLAMIAVGLHFVIGEESQDEKKDGAIDGRDIDEEPQVTVVMKKDGPAYASYGYDECTKAMKTKLANMFLDFEEIRKECVFVGRPQIAKNGHCQPNKCTRYQFRAVDMSQDLEANSSTSYRFEPKAEHDPVEIDASSQMFCKPKTEESDLAVCVNGICDNVYTGENSALLELKTTGEHGVVAPVFDNCDQRSPCWFHSSTSSSFDQANTIFDLPVFNRTHCDVECPNDGLTAAVVYMQHMHCISDDINNVADACDFENRLPFRFWECRKCDENFPADANKLEIVKKNLIERCNATTETPLLDPDICSVVCKENGADDNRRPRREFLPDGAPCRRDNPPAFDSGYCVRGGCFEVDRRGGVHTIAECQSEKENRLKKRMVQRIFTVPTTPAP